MTDPREGVSGNQVAPCPECGAQLAADQRYCLNCGRRCGEPRLDFRRYAPDQRAGGTSQTSASAPAPATVSPPDEKPQRDFTPLAAAGGIAVLGLMLLVGVLIGRGDSTASAPTPAPVVRVEGEGDTGTGGATASEKSDEGGALNLGSKGKSKGGEKASKAPPPEAVASDEELEALEGQSPQEYSESSAKLPNEIATPGEAPPTDSKAPGGGSKGTAIE